MNSRRHYFAQLGLAGSLILVGTCWVSGQQGRPHTTYRPQEDLSGVEVRTDSRFETNGTQQAGVPLVGQRSSAIVGSCVKLGDGQRIGRVDDLFINEDGCVDFMVVYFDGPSEFRGRLAAIPWRVGKMDFAKKSITLSVERDTLREAPIFFSRGRAWPNLYEPRWAANVHNYFGVETDIEQRVERAYGEPRDLDRDMPRGERGRDKPQPRDLEQRRQIQQPSDRHLDPKPVPMPDGNVAPEPRRDLNGDRPLRDQNRDTIRNNNDDEFSGKKSDRDSNGAKKNDRDDDDSPRPPE